MSPTKPSPPGSPEPAVTCDASGMAQIHRYFRAGFGEAPDLVRGVAAGDVSHATAVSEQLWLLSTALHTHHEGEDERLWDALASRAPACALHVERMKIQHAQMLEHLAELDTALPAWKANPAADTADTVLSALDGVNAALAEHLPDEEREIVPVMETTLTQEEVDWFSEHGRRATPRGHLWTQLGGIMAAQPDPDAWLRAHLPAPVRLMWRAVGRRRYAAQRAGLRRPA